MLCWVNWLLQTKINVVNMIGDAIFKVTEWDWLKIQLDLEALKSRGNYVSKHYCFDDDNRTITCSISWKYSKEEKTEKVLKRENLEVYMGWLKAEQMIIKKIMEPLSNMRTSFNLKKHFILEMLQETPGMSPNLICQIKGDEITWWPGY